MPSVSVSLPLPDREVDPEMTLRFLCSNSEGTLTTIARTTDADIPIVHWNSESVSESEMNQQLCETVSQRFQTYYENDQLNYITTGRENGETVACVAAEVNDSCSGILFALNTEINPRASLQRILRIRVPADGPISETGNRLYIKWDKFLNGEYPAIVQRRPRLITEPESNQPPDDQSEDFTFEAE